MPIKKRTSFNLCEWLIVIMAIIIITPLLNARIPTVVTSAIFGIWLIAALFQDGARISLSHYQKHIIISSLSFLFLILLYKFSGYSSAAIGNCYQQIMFFGAFFEYIYIEVHSDIEIRKKIFWVIWIVSVVNIIDNVRLGIIYPNASVNAVNLDWYPYLRNTNVGTTIFNTYVLIFFDICLLLFFTVKSNRERILFILSSAISAYYLVFFGLRATTVILLIISAIGITVTRNSKIITKNGVIRIVILVILGTIAVFCYDKIIMLILRILPDNRLASRLSDLTRLSEGIDEHSFSGRLTLMIESFRTFGSSVKNILFGIGDHRSAGGYAGFLATGIGGHSELIDSLARFGMIGFSLIIWVLSSYRKYLKEIFKGTKCFQQIHVIFYSIVLCMLIKSFFYSSLGVVVFLFIPLAYSIFAEEESVYL